MRRESNPDIDLIEARKLDFIGHLDELRKRLLISLGFIVFFSVLSFSKGTELIRLAQGPAKAYIQKLIFITPTEVFVSFMKVSLLCGFVFSFPFILYQLWLFIRPAVETEKRKNVFFWIMSSLVFFVSGLFFSYYVVLPAALKFLIGFGEGIAEANITINKYISFFTAFLLLGGCIFEIPVIMGLSVDIGIIKASYFRRKRVYALIVMLILAAFLTPTQDVFNMLIFAAPMVLLYEIGILISGIVEKTIKKHR